MRVLLCLCCFLVMRSNSAVLFVEEPSNTFGLENQKILLRCIYKSDKNATVSWFRNEAEINPATQEVKPSIETSNDGVTVASLAFQLLRHTEGDYFCNVSASGVWFASRKANVRISFLGEQFVLEPQDKTVSIGETVLLECVPPIGLPRPLIQWYKDNVTVRSDERLQVSETGSLRIDRVSWKDAGLYMCVAESFAFRRHSSMAKLTIRQRPYFVESPLSQSVGIHGSFELACRVAGEPMPMIFWRREPSFLEIPFDRTRLSLRGTLQFAHARLEDAGDYVCRAVSSAGVIEAVARISIVSPPGLIQTSPSTVSLLEGEHIELPCTAVGSPNPEVRWIRKNPLIYYIAGSEDPSERVFATRTGVLIISAARREDTSVYECRASSPAGLTRSITRLDVKENPYMYPARFGALSSGRINVPSGSSARIVCEFPVTNGSSTVLSPGVQHNMGVSNSEGLSITWRINGGPMLQRLGAPNRTLVERTGSLVIHQAGKQNEGNYTCLIFNQISRRYTSWTTQLFVDQSNTHVESHPHTMLPAAAEVPFNLTVIGKGDTWLMLQWSDVPDKRSDFHGYRVFYLPVIVGFRQPVPLASQDTAVADAVGKRKAKSSPSFDAWLSFPDLLQQKQARLIRLTPNTGYWVEVRKAFKYGYGAGALLPHIVYTLNRPSGIQLTSGVSTSNLVSANVESTLDVPFGSGSSAADFQGLLSNFQTISFHDVSVRSLTSTELVISWTTRSSSNILQQIDGFKVNIKPVPMSRCISTVTSPSANKLSFSYSDGQNSLKFIGHNERKDRLTHPMHCSLSSDDLLERIMRMPNGPVSTDTQVTRVDDISSVKPSPRTMIVAHGMSQVNSVTRAIAGGLVPFTCYELDVEAFKDDAMYGRISSPASRPELALTLDAPPSHAPRLMTVDWISDAVDLAANFTPTIPNGVRLSWSPLELRLSHGVLVGYVLHFLSNQSDHSRSFKVPADVHTRDVFGLDPYVEYTIYLAGVTCRGEGVRGPGYRLFPASSLFQTAYGEVTHPANMLSTKSKFPPWGYGIIIGVVVLWIFFGSMIPILTRRSPVKQSNDSNRSFDPQHPKIDRCWHWCIFCENNRSDLKRRAKTPTTDNPLARRSDSNSSYTFATAVHRDQMELANLLQRTDSHQTSASDQHGGELPGDHRHLPGGYSTSGSNSRGDPSMRRLPVQPEKSNYLAGDDAEVYANSDPSLVSDPANSLIINNFTSSGPMYHFSTAALQTPQQIHWNRPQLPDSVNVPFPVPPSYPFSDPTSPNSLKAFPTPDLSGEVTSGFVSQSGRPSHDTFTQLNGSDHQDVCTEDSVPPYASCSVLSAPRLQYTSSDLSQPYNLGTNKLTDGESLTAVLRGPAVMSKSISGQNVTGGLTENGHLEPVTTKQWPNTSRILPNTQPSHCSPYTASNGGAHPIPPPPEYPPPPLPTANHWVYPLHQKVVCPHSPGTGHSICVTPEYEGHVLRDSETSALVSIEPAHHYSSSGIYAQTQQEQPLSIPYLNNGLHPVSVSRFPQIATMEASTCLQRPSINQAHLPPAELHPSGLLKLDRMKPRSISAQRLERSATPSTRGGNSSTCGGGGSSSGRSTSSVIGSCGKKQCSRTSDRGGAVSSLSGSDSSGSGHHLNSVYHNPAVATSRFSSILAQSSVATSVLQQPPASADRFTIGLDQFPSTVFGHVNQLPKDAVTRGMRDNSSCSPQPAQSVNKASRHISGNSNPQPPIGPEKGFQNSLIVCNPRHQPVTGPGLPSTIRPAGPPDIGA